LGLIQGAGVKAGQNRGGDGLGVGEGDAEGDDDWNLAWTFSPHALDTEHVVLDFFEDFLEDC
jgi:hypothetical protein